MKTETKKNTNFKLYANTDEKLLVYGSFWLLGIAFVGVLVGGVVSLLENGVTGFDYDPLPMLVFVSLATLLGVMGLLQFGFRRVRERIDALEARLERGPE